MTNYLLQSLGRYFCNSFPLSLLSRIFTPKMGGKQPETRWSLSWKRCFMILLLLDICSTSAIAGSRVEFLPGFDGPLPFELETGYIGVGEREDVQFFYYFVKSESEPSKDPLLLWLTGGPGCSSFNGLVYEIGPIAFEAAKYIPDLEYNSNVPKLILNPNSWTKVANIIFLDMPVGTGFSYAKNPQALKTTDLQTYEQVNQFLRKFLVDHPEFIETPFYIGGDSYAGLYVPVITQFVADGNEIAMQPIINLKGYLIGNGVTSPSDNNYMVPYAHGMGLVSDEIYESLVRNCKGEYQNPGNQLCSQDMDTFSRLIKGIKFDHILENSCGFVSPKPADMSGERRSLDEILQLSGHGFYLSSKCRTDGLKYSDIWARKASVQEALHVRKGTIKQWNRCNRSLPFDVTVKDTVPYHASLSRKGLRSLIYSGDHDMIVTFLSTQAWIRSLRYPIIVDWHQWTVEGQVGGYTRTYANQMTFATVKGAGHTAPEYKPLECKSMFRRWISNEPL